MRESIERIYAVGRDHQGVRKGLVVHQWGDFVLGVVFLFGSALWTLYVVRGGFSWWILLAVFMAFTGLGAVMNGLENRTLAKPLQPTSGTGEGR